MDVFLVPVGTSRYELYCETSGDHAPETAAVAGGWWRRPVDRFRQVLTEAEEDGRRRQAGQADERGGLWRWVLRHVAEAIAEQRLLWRLGSAAAGRLIHPDDLTSARALDFMHASLQSDRDKHFRWLFVDGLLAIALAPLTVVPGPNVPALYFTFRAVGHFLALRGARRGLATVAWETHASPHLTALRDALTLEGHVRADRLAAIAAALGLDHLAAFVDRVAARPA